MVAHHLRLCENPLTGSKAPANSHHDPLMHIPASNLSIRTICAFSWGARFTVRVGSFEARPLHGHLKTHSIRSL